MEIMQRRFARRLLNAPKNAANETILLDLGINSIKTEIALKLLKFREKLISENDSFIGQLFKLNSSLKLNWEKRYQEFMLYYQIDETNLTQNHLENTLKIKNKEIQRQFDRLANITTTTTTLYRYLRGSNKGQSIYTELNPRRKLETGLIFQFRAGLNISNYSKYVRHLTDIPYCPFCNLVENESHIIEECPEYMKERETFIKKISELKQNIPQNTKLTEVVLYSYHFEEKIQNLDNKTKEKIDSLIKDYIYRIYIRRSKTNAA